MAPMLFTDAILNDRAIKVFNNGKMSRDFTYIDDIVDGIIKVIDKPATPNKEWNTKEPEISSSSAPYKIYNIGNNAPLPLMTFIETIEDALGKKAEKTLCLCKMEMLLVLMLMLQDLWKTLGTNHILSLKMV